jgi:hypothetical protein
MWPSLVVFDAPARNLTPRIPEIPKPARIQAFIAKPAMLNTRKRCAAGGHIAGKINRPFLVRCRRRLSSAIAAREPFAPNALHTQTRGTIHALHSFVVYMLARSPQQNMEAPVFEARLLARQLDQLLAQREIVSPVSVPGSSIAEYP